MAFVVESEETGKKLPPTWGDISVVGIDTSFIKNDNSVEGFIRFAKILLNTGSYPHFWVLSVKDQKNNTEVIIHQIPLVSDCCIWFDYPKWSKKHLFWLLARKVPLTATTALHGHFGNNCKYVPAPVRLYELCFEDFFLEMCQLIARVKTDVEF